MTFDLCGLHTRSHTLPVENSSEKMAFRTQRYFLPTISASHNHRAPLERTRGPRPPIQYQQFIAPAQAIQHAFTCQCVKILSAGPCQKPRARMISTPQRTDKPQARRTHQLQGRPTHPPLNHPDSNCGYAL